MTATFRAARARSVALVAVALLAVGLGGCSEDRIEEGEARLTITGATLVVDPDGTRTRFTDGTTVVDGEVVTVEEGTAVLETPGGSRYELRSGDVPSRLRIADPPELLAGDALLVDGFAARLVVDDVTIEALGPTRVRAQDRTVTPYVGTATLTGAPGLGSVRALRTAAFGDDPDVVPVAFDTTDAWDRRYLGEAAALGVRLEALARGYTQDLQPRVGLSVDFYRSVLPGLRAESDFREDLLEGGRAPGEVLVGAALAVDGRIGSFLERWEAIFSFRDDGAGWGIVALEQGVSAAPLFDSIELAIGESPLSDDPRPTTTSTSTTSTTTTTTPSTGVVTVPPPPTTVPPTPSPGDGASGGLLSPVLDPVTGLLDDVLGILGLG